jgi:hypothetical protein
MDHADILVALNRKILRAYSIRTIDALQSSLPLRLALPYLEPVIELNLSKEVRKDALVIRRAAETGGGQAAQLVQELYLASQSIDEDFLLRIVSFPVQVRIRYEEIEPVRVSRIRYLLHGAQRIFAAWTEHTSLRDAVHAAYDKSEFEVLLSVILELYARETRILSRGLKLPGALVPIAERVAQHLGKIMADAGSHLALEVTRGLYRA